MDGDGSSGHASLDEATLGLWSDQTIERTTPMLLGLYRKDGIRDMLGYCNFTYE
jgi:hypothetical protein